MDESSFMGGSTIPETRVVMTSGVTEKIDCVPKGTGLRPRSQSSTVTRGCLSFLSLRSPSRPEVT